MRAAYIALMPAVPFVKMHGLGNDFVVLDARQKPLHCDEVQARKIADRHTGVGCDQLIILEPPRDPRAELFMAIHNADGGMVEACGNATRCVADLVMREQKSTSATIETAVGLVAAHVAGRQRVGVDMGEPATVWRDIPLTRECDTEHVPLALGPLRDPVATSMGNPHVTFFVSDLAAVDIASLGPRLEHDALFPHRANIGVAQILSASRLQLRVWERGAGLTKACGTGACAALVAAARRGLTRRHAEIVVDGGTLDIEWRADNHVIMTGPVAVSFTGTLDPSLWR
jgi:diaminopimelate epimerase